MEDDANTSGVQPSVRPKRLVRIPRKTTVKVSGRESSTIAFPYMDLEAAISVAQAMIGAGGVGLTRDQLAGVMSQSASSGAFVTKVATARMFGFLSNTQGKYELTNLGFLVVDSDEKKQRAARAEAFLKVPLYRRVYEEFRGKQLPPRPHGLEQAFLRFGVAPKQKNTARLAFDKSAAQAGFFSNGPDRLIEPIIGPVSFERRTTAEEDFAEPEPQTSRPGSDTSGLHPFIQGLIGKLPEPETNWTIEGRTKWLVAAANIFDLIYNGDGKITITAETDSSRKEEQK